MLQPGSLPEGNGCPQWLRFSVPHGCQPQAGGTNINANAGGHWGLPAKPGGGGAAQ